MTTRQRPTRRQLGVLRAYIRAGSVAAAAYELGISETTVRQHLSGLYRRTGCLNAAQAAYLLGRADWHGDAHRPTWRPDHKGARYQQSQTQDATAADIQTHEEARPSRDGPRCPREEAPRHRRSRDTGGYCRTGIAPGLPRLAKPEIVGRQAELARAREAVARASVGSGCAVVITGEPGIGKTMLSQEVLRHARSRAFHVLEGRCDALTASLAYAPVEEAVGRARSCRGTRFPPASRTAG